MEDSDFPSRLRQIRAAKGLSQAEVSRQTGLAQTTISDWEKGATEPKIEKLRQIAEFFQCSTDYLVGLPDRPIALPAHHWIIDLDVYDLLVKHGKDAPIPGDESWACPIPSRSRIVTSTEYAAMRAAIPGVAPPKRRR